LVERARELRDLHEAAWRAATGTPNVVVVTGEAGAGKSRLASEFLRALTEEWSRTVLRASADDSLFAGPLGQLVGDLDRAGDRRWLGQALATELQRRSEAGPHVLALEDVHWLDPAGIASLGSALDRLAGVEVLVVMSYRLGQHPLGHPVPRAITRLLQDHEAVEMRLPLLGPAGVAAMAEELTGIGDPERDTQLYRRSGGNPLYVEELVRAGGGSAEDSQLPWTLSGAVHERLAVLPTEARAVATYLGLARSPLPAEVIDALDGTAGGTAALLESGLATRRGTDVDLRHALIGEALVDGLDTVEASMAHRLLAEVFAARGDGSADRAAHHMAAAGDTAQAAAMAVRVAERLRRAGDHRRATDMYRIAVLAPPAGTGPHAQLLRQAAVCAALAGESGEAQAWGQEAQLAESGGDAQPERPVTWLNPALRPRGVDPDPAEHGRLLLAAQAAVRSGDLRRGQALARRAALAALASGDPVAAADAGLTVGYAGDATTGRALVGQAVDMARTDHHPLDVARVLPLQARVDWMAGHVEAALDSDQEALVVARSVPGDELWRHLQAGVAFMLAGRGELGAAKSLAEELLEGDNVFAAALAQVPRAIVAMESGDRDAARATLEPMLPGVRALGIDYFTINLLVVLARLELLGGQARQCLLLLAEAEQSTWSPHHESQSDLLYLRGRALAHLGDRDGLANTAEQAADLARHAMGPGVVPVADALAGLLARQSDDLNEALRRLTAAALTWERMPRYIFAAEAWLLSADAAIEQGALGTAREALTRSEELARKAGASPLADEANARRKRMTGPSPSTGIGSSGLTARELDVVRLAAVGHTNGEIGAQLHLSPTTVRNYLSTAFAKLGVQRRSQLAAIVFGGDPVPAAKPTDTTG
jgi:DNA-binding CsgD family transcriptional regulator/tetratricopeptide (TPR) repeat protein